MAFESAFIWNPLLRGSGGYIDMATGRAVSWSAIRNELEDFIDGTKVDMRNVTQSLIDGNIEIAEWQLQMAGYAKDVNLAANVAARGGWEQMTPADFGRAGQQIKAQYEYLNNYAAEIASGKQPLNGMALNRSQMYADAGRGNYEQTRRNIEADKGATQERRVLGANDANNCETHGDKKGCRELAALGWVENGKLPRIGEAPCLTNCRCHFIYRKRGKGGRWIVTGA